MKPKPFIPEPAGMEDYYIKDKTSGEIWHRCHRRTLYAETDRSQVVYHANYLLYFEFGRASLMRDVAYPYRQVEESGYVYPIIDLGMSFFKPLYYDDPMWVHTRPSEKDRIRIKFDYIITHAETGELVCKGFTKHCALNLAGTPVALDPITDELWESFRG
ncbi:MAG: acyl-CoA thioesterase [bacterium]|nr:acyl-CoA thioesterase [bacterium]